MNTALIVTEMDIRLARAFVNGSIDEDELRSGFVPADAAIIEALKELLAETRTERDEAQADLMAAVGKITVQERRIHELESRVEAVKWQGLDLVHHRDEDSIWMTFTASNGDAGAVGLSTISKGPIALKAIDRWARETLGLIPRQS